MSALPVPSARLHVSGLTPAISAQDLKTKLGSFGAVKAVDGFGAKDGNGDPRTFAYITLDAQASQVNKCISSLSGTTWKGTKLRLAPAKPDFATKFIKQVEAEQAMAEELRPIKRQRLQGTHGREANDMSLVTVENVHNRKGWHKTPLNHLIRPMRMRPTRPLPSAPSSQAAPQAGKKKDAARKSRQKPIPTRARRRTIDPPKWGHTHLSGTLLENAVVADMPIPGRHTWKDLATADSMDSVTTAVTSDEESGSSSSVSLHKGGDVHSSDSSEDEEDQSLAAEFGKEPSPTVIRIDSIGQSLRGEVSQNRKLLDTLFSRGDTWPQQDAIDSDLEELVQKTDQQLVPGAVQSRRGAIGQDLSSSDESEDSDLVTPRADVANQQPQNPLSYNGDDDDSEALEASRSPVLMAETRLQHRSLKEMFAPREEEAGFSLLANLDLELELDDEFALGLQPAIINAEETAAAAPAVAVVLSPPTMALSAADQWRFEAEAPGLRPMFFLHSNAMNAVPTHGFWRTDTDEQIRARWENQKGPLTENWKKRAREAKKRGRRGGSGVGDVD
ncbi:hypothetical protein BKA62DRAFT_748474 [Auriculariales sp. MPI-PUGE-AT-0066]|nr:hypothetical protein BKA62DRAFT_748474 [Auriculariales sp. MPI-PUGE-AT-0066]